MTGIQIIGIETASLDWKDIWDSLFEQSKTKFPHGDEITLTFQKSTTPEEQASTDIAVNAAIEAGKAHNLKVVIHYEEMGTRESDT